MAIPRKDALLVPYTTNFNTRITNSAATYQITEAQVAAYTPLSENYVAAQQAVLDARAAGTRSESLTAARDTAKDALLTYARELYSFVQANNAISDADKIELGVHVKDTSQTPIPAPSDRPGVDIVSVVGRTVTVDVHDTVTSNKRGKPVGSLAAWVYSYVGSDYPANPAEWDFQGSTTTNPFKIYFPDTVPAGAKVWVTAAWINRKQQAGPSSMPVSTNIQYGGTTSATSTSTGEAEMNIAA